MQFTRILRCFHAYQALRSLSFRTSDNATAAKILQGHHELHSLSLIFLRNLSTPSGNESLVASDPSLSKPTKNEDVFDVTQLLEQKEIPKQEVLKNQEKKDIPTKNKADEFEIIQLLEEKEIFKQEFLKNQEKKNVFDISQLLERKKLSKQEFLKNIEISLNDDESSLSQESKVQKLDEYYKFIRENLYSDQIATLVSKDSDLVLNYLKHLLNDTSELGQDVIDKVLKIYLMEAKFMPVRSIAAVVRLLSESDATNSNRFEKQRRKLITEVVEEKWFEISPKKIVFFLYQMDELFDMKKVVCSGETTQEGSTNAVVNQKGKLTNVDMDNIEKRLIELLDELEPKDLARVVILMGKWRRRNQILLLRLVHRLSLTDLSHFTDNMLSNLLFACSVLSLYNSSLLTEISHELASRPFTSPASVSSLLTSFSHLKWRDINFISKCVLYLGQNLDKILPQESCVVLRSLANLNATISSEQECSVIKAIGQQALSSEISKFQLVDIAWSLAVLNLLDKDTAKRALEQSFFHSFTGTCAPPTKPTTETIKVELRDVSGSNPISILNEHYQPSEVVYKVHEESQHGGQPHFVMSCTIGDRTFISERPMPSKREAKLLAATKALLELFNIIYDPEEETHWTIYQFNNTLEKLIDVHLTAKYEIENYEGPLLGEETLNANREKVGSPAHEALVLSLHNALEKFVDIDTYFIKSQALPCNLHADAVMCAGSDGTLKPLQSLEDSKDKEIHRLAIQVIPFSGVLSNEPMPCGAHLMAARHLRHLGYTAVQIPYSHLRPSQSALEHVNSIQILIKEAVCN